MDNDRSIGFKRKLSVDDPFDDSFEVFLPNKLQEKSILSQLNICSRNKTNRKKKSSPNSSSSSTSQETYDSDMEQVMAVCLSKNNFLVNPSASRNKEIKDNNWKELTNKMKRQPLLMKRTAADREAILSQKLALILVDEKAEKSEEKFTLIDLEDLIESELLLQQWCKTCRLWSASRLQALKIKDFYIEAFSKYIELSERLGEEVYDMEITKALSPESRNVNKNYGDDDNDAFESSLNENPFTAEDQCVEKTDEQSSIDLFESSQMEESPNSNVFFPQRVSNTTLDDNQNDSALFCNKKIDATSEEIIELSSSPSSNKTTAVPCIDTMKSQNNFSPSHSYCSTSTVNVDRKLGMLDRIGVTLLAEQWDNLFNSNEGDITVLLENDSNIRVHKFVLSVRCPLLVYEISDDKLHWNSFSLDTAKAFFRYVYSGKCDHLWHLKSSDKARVKILAILYELNHLEEVLLKLHDSTNREINSAHKTLSVNKSSNNSSSSTIAVSPVSMKTGQNLSINLDEHPYDNTIHNILDDGAEINSIVSNADSNRYAYIMSPSPVNTSKIVNNEHVAHPSVKKSLEVFFQESFPELPCLSRENSPITKYATTTSKVNLLSSESFEDKSDKCSLDIPLTCNSTSPKSWSSYSTKSEMECMPSTSFAELSSAQKSSFQLSTPNSFSSEVVFSKNVTPFPDYDSMITPQLKRELQRFGLKRDMGTAKAKLLLKYIYDQIHPVVDSDKGQVTQSTNLERNDSLTATIGNIVKSNKELYSHILLFKPIWLENFYRFLKEQGIVCSANQLKDALNTLGITYRTKNTRENLPRTKKKKPPKI